MDEIAPEYDVVVLGTGEHHPHLYSREREANNRAGLTECVLSGYAREAALTKNNS